MKINVECKKCGERYWHTYDKRIHGKDISQKICRPCLNKMTQEIYTDQRKRHEKISNKQKAVLRKHHKEEL